MHLVVLTNLVRQTLIAVLQERGPLVAPASQNVAPDREAKGMKPISGRRQFAH